MALIERNNWKYWTKSVLVSSVIAVLEWKMGEELDAVGIPNSGSSKWKLLNSRFVNQGVFLARPSINRLFLFNSGYSRIHHLCRIKIQPMTSRNNSYHIDEYFFYYNSLLSCGYTWHYFVCCYCRFKSSFHIHMRLIPSFKTI